MKAKKRIARLTSTTGPDATVLLTIVGHRLVTRSGYGFSNPNLPHFLVHAVGVGFTAPSKEQETEAVRLWLTGSDASAAYRFPSSRLPVIEDGCGYDANPSPVPSAGDTTEND